MRHVNVSNMSEPSINQNQPNQPTVQKPLLPLKYISHKGGQYRTFHADGVWALQGAAMDNVLLEFYVEHGPLPTAVVQPLTQEGQFTGEQEQQGVLDSKYWIVNRDFQFGVVLSPPAVVQLSHVLRTIMANFSPQARAIVETIYPNQLPK